MPHPLTPLRRALLAGALAVAAWLPTAQAAVDEAVAQQLMQRSGLWEQLAALAPVLAQGQSAGLQQVLPGLNDAQRQLLGDLAARSYGAAALQRSALEALAPALEPTHVAVLRAWLDSADGQRVAEVEVASAQQLAPDAAQSPQEAQAARKARDEAALAAATPARRALLQRLVVLSQVGEVQANIIVRSTLALFGSAAMMLPPQAPPLPLEAMKEELAAKRPQIVAQAETDALANFAYSYAALDDGLLERYLQVLATPAGQHYTAASAVAVEQALAVAASRLGEGLPALRDAASSLRQPA